MNTQKILIAEDDHFLAHVFELNLTEAGCEVKVARNGVHAFEVLDGFEPDLIVLDLMMPIKDGFSTLRDLKDHDRWKHIPVIVASNLCQEEDIEYCLALGAHDYLIKSEMSFDSLVAKITAHLKPTLSHSTPTFNEIISNFSL